MAEDVKIFHACMYARSLQSCPTLCDLMQYSLPGSSCLWDSSGKNTEAGCHALLQGTFHDSGIESTSLLSPALAGKFSTATLCPLNNNSLLHLPSLGWLFSVSISLTILDTLEKWSHIIFMFYWEWLISLSMVSSHVIHVATCIRIPFLFKANIPMHV